MVQRIFAGEKPASMPALPDIHGRELALMTALLVIVFWLGVYPQPVINTAEPAIQNLQQIVNQTYGDEEIRDWRLESEYAENLRSPILRQAQDRFSNLSEGGAP